MTAPATPPAAGDAAAASFRGWKGKIKLVVFSLVPVAILVIIAEVLAGITIVRSSNLLTDSATGAHVQVMRTGRWPWSRRTLTPVNSQGFPEVEFASVGPKGDCLHVVYTGDSFAYGDGVDRDSSFIEIVKRAAAARPGRCIRMFNLGERGSTVDRQARRVRETMAQLQPDIVIMVQYQNDLTDMTKPGGLAVDSTRGPAVQRWGHVQDRLSLFNPNIVKYLTYHAFAYMITHDLKRDVLRHWSVLADSTRQADAVRLVGLYEASFDSMVAELKGRQIDFGVVIVPSKFDVMAGRYPEEAVFLRLAEKHQLPALRLFPAMDSVRQPYAFLMYDGHLSEAGNRLVADRIERWLFSAEPPPFPRLRASAPEPPPARR